MLYQSPTVKRYSVTYIISLCSTTSNLQLNFFILNGDKSHFKRLLLLVSYNLPQCFTTPVRLDEHLSLTSCRPTDSSMMLNIDACLQGQLKHIRLIEVTILSTKWAK